MHEARITERRLKILKLVGKGYCNTAIAQEMNMSVSNVKLQISRAITFFKTGTRHRAVICALKQRFISLDDL